MNQDIKPETGTTEQPPVARKVLVLGRSDAVLQTVLDELTAFGIEARGTASPESAADHFDARDFDLIALGRGLLGEAGDALKARLRQRHPGVRLLDTYAPFAAHQIIAALDREQPPAPDLDAYCARIGYHGPLTPTLETLQGLHARHPDAIAFEAIDVLLDRGVDISPKAVEDKLIHAGRGGYCFEHNGLFKRVLEALGFHVEGLTARVRWMAKPGTAPQPHSHMALKVWIDHRPWLVDVGFGGNVLTTPLRMDTTEPQPTQHETFRLIPYGPGLLLQAQIDGDWRPVYELSGEPLLNGDYEVANWYTSTYPQSPFRSHLMVARTTPDARYKLLNGRLTTQFPDGTSHRQELDAESLEQVLRDTFGLPVTAEWRGMIERAIKRTAEADPGE
ncbi:arylamine N-acetyltransferase family protein [Marinobacter sp. JSM 1782161]|uniref:arylamine N-acetyltransferase family protein n=1 Tax=Marinobacter sp. JSM 1782161 TaxID=2685906 RepID=UPI001403FADD|nr:arylamine N-acetyltransferase [Marinobacter sp. JSM 1782161]